MESSHPIREAKRADDVGKFEFGRFLGAARQFFADDRTHAAGHEREIGDGEDDRPAANKTTADHGGVGHARLRLLGFDALLILDAIFEIERVFGA